MNRILPSILLAVTVLCVFWPATAHDFVNYDDLDYVTANPHVLGGLTSANVAWAFSTTAMGSWHPLTWLSLMLDAQIGGGAPRTFHCTNVLLHAANAALVFLFLSALTRALWRSLAVAALFALHPLAVEPVAWIAERKELLAAGFGLLTLWSWAMHLQGGRKCSPGYAVALLCLALGLLCKPSLVALPVVLLLLDFWPANRFQARDPRWLLIEKGPFFVLSLSAGLLTLATQGQGGFILAQLPFGDRLANALISYPRYLGKLFWPAHLAVFYPHPGHWPLTAVLLATLLLVTISVAAVRMRRSQPALFVGWFWFVALLLPTIGLVQAGEQSMADRYLYLPGIGLFLALSWALDWLCARKGLWLPVAALTACAVLAFALQTRRQLSYWRDSSTLFTHAASVTTGNYLAENNLGTWLLAQGQGNDALPHFRRALEYRPGYPYAHNNLGLALAESDPAAAEVEFRLALRSLPDYPQAHRNLGTMLARRGDFPGAVTEYEAALRGDPDSVEIQENLARARAALH